MFPSVRNSRVQGTVATTVSPRPPDVQAAKTDPNSRIGHSAGTCLSGRNRLAAKLLRVPQLTVGPDASARQKQFRSSVLESEVRLHEALEQAKLSVAFDGEPLGSAQSLLALSTLSILSGLLEALNPSERLVFSQIIRVISGFIFVTDASAVFDDSSALPNATALMPLPIGHSEDPELGARKMTMHQPQALALPVSSHAADCSVPDEPRKVQDAQARLLDDEPQQLPVLFAHVYRKLVRENADLTRQLDEQQAETSDSSLHSSSQPFPPNTTTTSSRAQMSLPEIVGQSDAKNFKAEPAATGGGSASPRSVRLRHLEAENERLQQSLKVANEEICKLKRLREEGTRRESDLLASVAEQEQLRYREELARIALHNDVKRLRKDLELQALSSTFHQESANGTLEERDSAKMTQIDHLENEISVLKAQLKGAAKLYNSYMTQCAALTADKVTDTAPVSFSLL